MLALAYWLGLNPAVDSLPADVWRRELDVSGARAALLGPRSGRTRGAFFVIQGLHYAGPADPRMDRFLRVLAAAGNLVYAPYLSDLLRLRVTPASMVECADHFRRFVQRSGGLQPSVFAISYGSLLGFRLAALPDLRDHIKSLFVFGGYADWRTSLRFALTGRVGDARVGDYDPLNRAVVYLNLADRIIADPGDRKIVCDAWERFVHQTWNREGMKKGGFLAHSEAMATALPGRLRDLFLAGCGHGPAELEALSEATDAGPIGEFLDPRPILGDIRAPVHLLHGRDDDVIPYTQLAELVAHLPPEAVTTYLTGLYSHATNVGLLSQLENLPLLKDELTTLAKLTWALSA